MDKVWVVEASDELSEQMYQTAFSKYRDALDVYTKGSACIAHWRWTLEVVFLDDKERAMQDILDMAKEQQEV